MSAGVPVRSSFLAAATPCLNVVEAENFSPALQKSLTEADFGMSLQPPSPTTRVAVSSTVPTRVAPRLMGSPPSRGPGQARAGSPYRKQRVDQREHHPDQG